MFTWTCTPSSGNITGWANNAVPTTTINHILDNTGYNIEWATYQVAPTSNGCVGPLTNYVVTVFPTPDLSNMPPSMQICNNTNTNLALTSNVAGASFTWTCTPSSANVTGWANNAVPTTVLNQFLTNLGLNTEWVTYHVTPTANGCLGPVTDYTVTRRSIAGCVLQPGGTDHLLAADFEHPGAVYCSWDDLHLDRDPQQSQPFGTGARQRKYHRADDNELGEYDRVGDLPCHPYCVWVSAGDYNEYHSHGEPESHRQQCCDKFPDLFSSEHEHRPLLFGSRIRVRLDRIGFVGEYHRIHERCRTSIVQALTNTGFNIEAATYQVSATANGCTGNTTPFTVTVFPVANVIFTPNGQTFCSGLTTAINLSSGVAGTSYTWTATGSAPSISGYFPGSGNIIQQTLFNSGPYPESATSQVGPTANGCPGPTTALRRHRNPFLP